MSLGASISRSDRVVALTGELSFGTVVGLLERSRPLFRDASAGVCVDLSGVTRADSAGLSLLLEWMRLARDEGCTIEFANLPEQMWSIARTCGLDRVLPVVV